MDNYKRAYKIFLLSFILSIIAMVVSFVFIGIMFSQIFVLFYNPMALTTYIAQVMIIFMPIMLVPAIFQSFLLYSTIRQDLGVIGGDYGIDIKDHERLVKFILFLPITVIVSLGMIMLSFPMLLNSVANYQIVMLFATPMFILAIILICLAALSLIGQILLAIYIYNIGKDSGSSLLEIGGLFTIFIGFVGYLLIALGFKKLLEQK